MIKPDEYYDAGDSLRGKQKDAMWRAIRMQSSAMSSRSLLMWDRRSFVFGMAASLILGLALYGGWSIARQVSEASKPQPLRLEQAYVSAIHEFEEIVPTVQVKGSQAAQAAGQLTQRHEQLKLVDEAIAALRRQTNGTDLSPRKRDHLRQLYSLKLQILQQMIEEGEVEL